MDWRIGNFKLSLQMRKEYKKIEHSTCKNGQPVVLTITYKDYGKGGWEFDKLECSKVPSGKGYCVCQLRRLALLSKK